MIKTIVTITALFMMASPAHAKRLHHEKWYQDRECTGIKEYVLSDRTRVDCLTEKNAIEYDFGDKWPEGLGQSLYYSLQTGKRAGIGLILESPKDTKYWIRMNSTIQNFNLPIDTWIIKP